MEKQLLITLVSKQAVVAAQFIKWALSENRNVQLDVLCLTNSKMNYCINYIQEVFKDNERINFLDTLEISENDYTNVKDSVYKRVCTINKFYNNALIDITLGKKIMSIGVFQASIDLLSKFHSLSVYYQDNYNKSIQKIFPGKKEQLTLNLEDLTVADYFNCYGFSYKNNNCLFDYETSKKVPELLAGISEDDKSKINQNIKEFNFKNTEISTKDTGISCETIKKIEDFAKNDLIIPEQIKNYLFKGKWFEEYCFYKIKENLKIKESRIAIKVKLKKQNSKESEQIIDIAYLDKENFLHVVDCKSFISSEKSTKILKDSIYKFKSIASELGLNSKNDLLIASEINNKLVKENANLFGIRISDNYIN
jgi:hypothetical protein